MVYTCTVLSYILHMNIDSTNKHAGFRTRIDRNGKIRTETSRRDSGMDVALSTDRRTHSTQVFIDLDGRSPSSFSDGASLVLSGRQARTLYRALERHFEGLRARGV